MNFIVRSAQDVIFALFFVKLYRDVYVKELFHSGNTQQLKSRTLVFSF